MLKIGNFTLISNILIFSIWFILCMGSAFLRTAYVGKGGRCVPRG